MSFSHRKPYQKRYFIGRRETGTEPSACPRPTAVRSTRLDMKANTLLAAIGLLGALVAVLQRGEVASGVLLGFLALGGVLALASVVFAVRSLLIAEHKRIPDTALFDAALLDRADEKDGRDGVAEYQRHLLPAMWKSHQATCEVNDRKAAIVRWGQIFFICAVASPLAGSLLVAFGL